MKKLDDKFYGVIFKSKDNSVVPPDQWMVFLAKDDAIPATLKFYIEECGRLGASPEQLASAANMLARVLKLRAEHPELCKVPDVAPGEVET